VIKRTASNTIRFLLIFFGFWFVAAMIDQQVTGREITFPYMDRAWLWLVMIVAAFLGSLHREQKS
jgi:hypothetical protein